jgi:hypothetical protein
LITLELRRYEDSEKNEARNIENLCGELYTGSMRAFLRRYALLGPKVRRFSRVRLDAAVEVSRILKNEAHDIFYKLDAIHHQSVSQSCADFQKSEAQDIQHLCGELSTGSMLLFLRRLALLGPKVRIFSKMKS